MNLHMTAPTTEQRGSVDGIETSWLQASTEGEHAPVLYVHGVPNSGEMWRTLLERTGGFAPDLPGFGQSDKPAGFDYSIEGYGRWLRTFADQRELNRFSLVVHDWGVVGLALAQAAPERIERLVLISAVPFLPNYRWHLIARQWRRPVLGEMAMGFTFKSALRVALNRSNRDPMPTAFVDEVWEHFDHGTQRAILKLYRSAPAEKLAQAGGKLGEIGCPALLVHGGSDPYIPVEFMQRYADALGGDATLRVLDEAGHWPWLDEPALVDEIAGFISTSSR